MSAKKPKQISGPEFQGRENIEFADIDDWITTGGTEATKVALDDHNWNGDAVMTVELRLSPDNKKVVDGRVCLVGELMKNQREIRANRLTKN